MSWSRGASFTSTGCRVVAFEVMLWWQGRAFHLESLDAAASLG